MNLHTSFLTFKDLKGKKLNFRNL